jgi:hypothetical protein
MEHEEVFCECGLDFVRADHRIHKDCFVRVKSNGRGASPHTACNKAGISPQDFKKALLEPALSSGLLSG